MAYWESPDPPYERIFLFRSILWEYYCFLLLLAA